MILFFGGFIYLFFIIIFFLRLDYPPKKNLTSSGPPQMYRVIVFRNLFGAPGSFWTEKLQNGEFIAQILITKLQKCPEALKKKIFFEGVFRGKKIIWKKKCPLASYQFLEFFKNFRLFFPE